MKGVADLGKNGEVELDAFMAGNDILLMPTDVAKAKEKFLRLMKKVKFPKNAWQLP